MTEGWEPWCMTKDELEGWRDANDAAGPARARRPCDDCPIAWARQMRSRGKCNGHPAGTSRRDWERKHKKRNGTEPR